MDRLRKEFEDLVGNGDGIHFHIQILPSLSVQEKGALKQISCLYQSMYEEGPIVLTAFFEKADTSYQICQKNMESDIAEAWFQQLLEGCPDFAGWERTEEIIVPENTENQQNEEKAAWYQLSRDPNGVMTYWHQLLIIFGENWHDEHKFFSARDVELAVEGVQTGKYQKAVLEWGVDGIDIFSGRENDLMLIWRVYAGKERDQQFLAKEGTVSQVKFWLMQYLKEGDFGDMNSWANITAQVMKEWRKYNG